MKNILDIARVVRSKNSGPYELVLDIMLKNRTLFDALRESGQFTPERLAAEATVATTGAAQFTDADLDMLLSQMRNSTAVDALRKIVS